MKNDREFNETNGFVKIKESLVSEINAVAHQFEHAKTGARLLHLSCEDDNKVFTIVFFTPPEDSTGLPHILEHSVLCGSKKFPSKEPFLELIKGSLKTFVNAMTYPDKTIYPVASKNEADFFNLVSVYMDAVFFPKIHELPEILMQEGWHYEIEKAEDELKYKGVVYNEMRGSYSTPEAFMFTKITEGLFPDTIYKNDSGGNPRVIPNLTLGEFREYHKKHYHPSNCFIILYGDLEIERMTSFIHREYLSKFERRPLAPRIPIQHSFEAPIEQLEEYPIAMAEDPADKTYLALSFVVGSASDPEIYHGFAILTYLLLETPASPLKKALLDSGICKDVFGAFDNSLKQPIFSIVAKGSNPEHKAEFLKIVFDTLGSIVRNGIDKKLVEASININEFRLREADFRGFPKGLVYTFMSLGSWLYSPDPLSHLRFNGVIERVKSALHTDYFERMISKWILENSHRSLITLVPRPGLTEKQTAETQAKLAGIKARMSKKEVELIIERNRSLKLRQGTPDSEEALEKIPMLSLADINPLAERLPCEERELSGVKVLAHPLFTSGIGYLSLYFDTRCVPQDLIPYLSLLAELLGRIDTEKYGYSALSNEINIHTGGIDFSAEIITDKKSEDTYYPLFRVGSKALIDKLPELVSLISEILFASRFDDRKRLLEIVEETKSRLEMRLGYSGSFFASIRALSYSMQAAGYREAIEGISYYRFISGIARSFASGADALIEKLVELSKIVINRNGLIASFASSHEDYTALEKSFPRLLAGIPSRNLATHAYRFEPQAVNEAFCTPSEVQYVAKAGNFKKAGYDFSGKMLVLSQILSAQYLWNRVRVQGGAYGGSASIQRDGSVLFSSYRDPNLAETLSIYDEAGSYISGFDTTSRELTKFIIGITGALDHPLTPSMKAERATRNFIGHLSQEDIQAVRDGVLSSTLDEIRSLGALIEACMKQNLICVIGNEEKLNKHKELFGAVTILYE